MKCAVQHPVGVCIHGPERHRERCRWPAVASKNRCRFVSRRSIRQQASDRAMLSAMWGLAMGGIR